jgi:hypothetical protein
VSCNGRLHFGAGVLWASTRTVHTLSGFGTRGVFLVGSVYCCAFWIPILVFLFSISFSFGISLFFARQLSLPSLHVLFLCNCIIGLVDRRQLAGYKREWCGKQGNLNEHDLYSSNRSLPGRHF